MTDPCTRSLMRARLTSAVENSTVITDRQRLAMNLGSLCRDEHHRPDRALGLAFEETFHPHAEHAGFGLYSERPVNEIPHLFEIGFRQHTVASSRAG